MKIALITLCIEKKDSSKFYNSQAEGIAKAMSAMDVETKVYHMIPDLSEEQETVRKDGIEIVYLKCRHIGKHVYPDWSKLDTSVDCYITASDNYIGFHSFVKWCNKHNILCLPYVGVIHSNNTSKWKRMLVDFLCNNTKYYQKMTTVVKTPALQTELEQKNASMVVTIPVGLDEKLLNTQYISAPKGELKQKWGYQSEEKVILFIGRLTEEKNPCGMIRILQQLVQQDQTFRLLMVGKGELRDAVQQEIERLDMQTFVKCYEQIPNDQIWELYRIADASVNLNTHEIFGMAILEAMYYECPVYAMHAPGPDTILENGKTGYLFDEILQIPEAIVKTESDRIIECAKECVETKFMWKHSAKLFLDIIQQKNK